ncbi:MAG: sensor histidine kinase [Pseudonocardia sp.]
MLVTGWLNRWWGVRAASALSAAGLVAGALALGGLALVALQNRAVRTPVKEEAEATGELVERELAAGASPEDAVRASLGAFAVVQVLDASGTVLAASPQLGNAAPMHSGRPVFHSPEIEDPDLDEMGPDVDDGPVLVVSREVATAAGPRTVLTAGSLDPAEKSARSAAKLALVGVPLAALVAAVATYAATGRALRPVERIRADVAGLTDRHLDRRVAEPSSHDEVGRLARTMNDMLARLEAARRTQRRFVADAGHELRSPLATIVARLELVHRARPEDDDVSVMLTEAHRLAGLVDDLLLLARTDERGLLPARDDVDLDELVESVVGGQDGGPPLVVGRTVPVRVVGDRAQLMRVIRNLVDNARRHAVERVDVELHTDGDAAVLVVSDDGAGIPPEQHDRVFERFVRLDEARARDGGGTGLGLAIVAEVVAAHGGTVTVGTASLGGARMTVRLSGQEPSEGVPCSPSTLVARRT